MARTRPTSATLLVAAFLLLLVVPLYALTAIVVIRSGILKFDKGGFTDDQFKSMWTFIASGLATCATVLAALLTKSHNERSLALQAETDRRKAALEREATERMRLETVVGGLNLMHTEGRYSPKAVTAGGLATLVELGHPPIAMRVLAAALDDDAVDPQTAAWLLGKGLLGHSTEGVEEAASLLDQHGHTFTDPDHPAFFSWPGCVTARWILGLSPNAGMNVQSGLIELLVSQSRTWWQGSWTWVIYTLDEAMVGDPSPQTRANAATWASVLLEFVGDDPYIQGIQDARPKGDVAERASQRIAELGFRDNLPLQAVRDWGADPNWKKQPSAPSQGLPTTVPKDKQPPPVA